MVPCPYSAGLNQSSNGQHSETCPAERAQASCSASVSAAVEAAAVPGAAAAGRQLWGGHGGSLTGPQARPPHLSPLPGCIRVLLPICQAGNSLCAHPTGLLLKLLLLMSTVLTARCFRLPVQPLCTYSKPAAQAAAAHEHCAHCLRPCTHAGICF